MSLRHNSDDKDGPNSQVDHDSDTLNRYQLLSERNKESNIVQRSNRVLPPEEANKVGECYKMKDNIIMWQ